MGFILLVIGFLWITFWWAKVSCKREERTYNYNTIVRKTYTKNSLVVFHLKKVHHSLDEVINFCANILENLGIPYKVVSVNHNSTCVVITIKIL